VKRALSHLKRVDWSRCEESSCHGDLTLENIIIRDGELYLIDFLDSFYNSWMIDVAKILQDIECFWSYRHEPRSLNLHVRAVALKYLLTTYIRSRHGGEEYLVMVYNLLLLNLLRILPYTKDEETLKYLYGEIDRLTIKIVTKQL
jgi:thiamine kinase-like enzyme